MGFRTLNDIVDVLSNEEFALYIEMLWSCDYNDMLWFEDNFAIKYKMALDHMEELGLITSVPILTNRVYIVNRRKQLIKEEIDSNERD